MFPLVMYERSWLIAGFEGDQSAHSYVLLGSCALFPYSSSTSYRSL